MKRLLQQKQNFSLKIKRILLFCFLSLHVFSTRSQELPIFNLKNQETLIDSQQITLSIQKGTALSHHHADSALTIFEEAYIASKQIGYWEGVIQALIKQGNIYRAQFLTNEALEKYRSAIYYCNYTPQLKQYLTAIYMNIGSIYSRQGDLQTAINFYYQAEMLHHIYGSSFQPALLYANMSIIYAKLEQESIAMHYSNMAENAFKRQGDWAAWANLQNNKATIFIQLNRLEEAEQILKTILSIADTNNMAEPKIGAANNLAEIYLRKSNPTEALSVIAQTTKNNPSSNIFYNTVTLYTQAKIHLHQGKYKLAQKELELVLQNANILSIHDLAMDAHKFLAEAYTANHNSDLALLHYKSYMQYKDSIMGKETAKNIYALELKYQKEKADKSILQKQLIISQQDKVLTQKNSLLLLTGLIALVTLFVLTFLFVRFIHKKKLLIKQLEIDNLNAIVRGEENERKRLAQELHDGIGSMLASINMNIGALKKESQEIKTADRLQNISKMIQDTATEVRKTAHNLTPDILLKNNLEKALSLHLEQLNESNQLLVHFQTLGDLSSLHKSVELMLYRIIQELVQNIIKHAKASEAFVEIIHDEGQLNIRVEDNGIGFDTLQTDLGYGLENLKYRIASLKGELEISSNENMGTTIHILFDYNFLNKENLISIQ